MATIPTYTAQRSLNPGSTPNDRVVNPMADELVNLGGEVQQAAGVFIQRAEQREDFKVENDYRRLNLELQNDLNTQAQDMPEGGDGFHDKFMSETFKPKRDAFLSTVPERLRPKFDTILADDSGADATEWSVRGATFERDENYRWQKEQIGLTQQETAVAIGMNPDAYNDYLKSGTSLIDASSLPTPEKAKLKVEWENMAQVAMLNNLLETNPSGVLRELGYDPRQLSPTTQFEVLSRAVQSQESADNPNAVSAKGAVGLMQVMPTTAREIADKIGDENFPRGENDVVVSAYLTNPFVSKRYGEYYLKEQLRTFANSRDPIEAALVAYNAGPSVAQKWIESGYDDKLLPKETRDYKTEIMSTLKSSAVKGDPSSVQFVGSTKGVSDDLQARTRDAFATLGLTKVKVTSGARDEKHNKEVGGAKNSQHLTGNAMDIDVSGMKNADKIELLKALSNSGVTGLGVYGNSIHVDLGGRRAWGPDYSSGSIPAWAKPILAQHLNGTTPPARAVNQRYAALPYDQRQQFVSKANQLITANAAQTTKSSAVEKQQVKQSVVDELARVRATGQGSASFDATNVATVLGEDDYVTYQRDVQTAQRTFTALDGLSTMSMEDMDARAADYVADPTSPTFADDQRVEAAVQKEIDRVNRLRATHPDQAALEFPEVQGVATKVAEEAGNGGVSPTTAQDFVRTMLDAQDRAGILPEAAAPVTHDWAIQIGRTFSSIPDAVNRANLAAGKNQKLTVRDAMLTQIQDLQETFGRYADEVLTYSLAEYTNMDKNTAKIMTKLIEQLETGRGPFKAEDVDAAVEQENIQSYGIFDKGSNVFGQTPLLTSLGSVFTPVDGGNPTGDPAVDDMETRRRAVLAGEGAVE